MAASTSVGWIMVKVMGVSGPAASAAVGEPAFAGGRRRRCHGGLAFLSLEVDLGAAERIHPNNLKKVIRALERASAEKEPIKDFSGLNKKTEDYEVILIGLKRDREDLYERINNRVDKIVKSGLTEEVSGLLAMGLTEDDISMKGIGYKEMIGYLNGRYDKDEAVRLIKRNTRHYAKRQMTWFRRL